MDLKGLLRQEGPYLIDIYFDTYLTVPLIRKMQVRASTDYFF